VYCLADNAIITTAKHNAITASIAAGLLDAPMLVPVFAEAEVLELQLRGSAAILQILYGSLDPSAETRTSAGRQQS